MNSDRSDTVMVSRDGELLVRLPIDPEHIAFALRGRARIGLTPSLVECDHEGRRLPMGPDTLQEVLQAPSAYDARFIIAAWIRRVRP